MTAGNVFYAKRQQCYVLKFVGDIRYTECNGLERFLKQLFKQQDFDDVLIDLSEATSIDSTNLGLLALIANHMRRQSPKPVTLVSLNDDIDQTLDGVGFFQVFDIRKDPSCCCEAEHRLPATQPSRQELSHTVREAHQCLSDLNERNRLNFKNVLEALREH